MPYKYYQPNKMDIKDEYSDCTIRALTRVLDISWIEAFDLQIPLCRKYQVPNIFFCPSEMRKKLMIELGFKYTGISNKKGSVRPTISEFAKDNSKGSFICIVANHVVAVVDGTWYDTWDCGNRKMYGYYIKS